MNTQFESVRSSIPTTMATIMPKNVLTPHTTANNETISSRVFISLLARIDRLIVKAIAFHAHGQKIQQHCTTIRRLFTKNKLVIIKLSDRHIKHWFFLVQTISQPHLQRHFYKPRRNRDQTTIIRLRKTAFGRYTTPRITLSFKEHNNSHESSLNAKRGLTPISLLVHTQYMKQGLTYPH